MPPQRKPCIFPRERYRQGRCKGGLHECSRGESGSRLFGSSHLWLEVLGGWGGIPG